MFRNRNMTKIITLLTLILLPLNAYARADAPEARVFRGDDGDNDFPEFPLPSPGPEETWAGANLPWYGILRDVKANLAPDRNYLVWIHVPARHPLDLRTSDRFRKWIIATPPAEMSISHNMVAWRCRNGQGEMKEGATGMTGELAGQSGKMIERGFGLSAFLSVFTDGYLNPSIEVDQYVRNNLDERGVVFAAFEVTPEQCAGATGFLHDFVFHPRQPYTRFGLLPEPGKMQGGGCVTLASELMKRAGILDSVIPHFYRHLKARRALMGGNLPRVPVQTEPPAMPWLGTKKRKISLQRLMLTNWTTGLGPFVDFSQMDPEKMLYALRQFGAVYLEQVPPEQYSQEKAALGRFPLSPRQTVGRNVSLGKPHFVVTPINDQFEGMSEIKAASQAWIRGKLNAGFGLRRGEAMGMSIFILEKR